jgi:hypothetical protein
MLRVESTRESKNEMEHNDKLEVVAELSEESDDEYKPETWKQRKRKNKKESKERKRLRKLAIRRSQSPENGQTKPAMSLIAGNAPIV